MPPSLQYRSEYIRFHKARLRKRRAKAALIDGACPHCFKPGQAKNRFCKTCFLIPDLATFDDEMERARLEFIVASGKPLRLYKED